MSGQALQHQPLSRRTFLDRMIAGTSGLAMASGLTSLWTGGLSRAWAGPFATGVESIAQPNISGEERNTQPDIWALEVHFKPVRMVYVDLPVPESTETVRTLVWYLCYRVINRMMPGGPTTDVAEADRPLFVPELILSTESDGKVQNYYDRVIPEAEKVILKRERYPYKNSVDVVGPLPPLTPLKAKTEVSRDGFAMWRGVNPKIRRFQVFFCGFSNGYRRVPGPDGMEIVQRKTLSQSFWRPADEFEQREEEIRLDDDPKWIYR